MDISERLDILNESIFDDIDVDLLDTDDDYTSDYMYTYMPRFTLRPDISTYFRVYVKNIITYRNIIEDIIDTISVPDFNIGFNIMYKSSHSIDFEEYGIDNPSKFVLFSELADLCESKIKEYETLMGIDVYCMQIVFNYNLNKRDDIQYCNEIMKRIYNAVYKISQILVLGKSYLYTKIDYKCVNEINKDMRPVNISVDDCDSIIFNQLKYVVNGASDDDHYEQYIRMLNRTFQPNEKFTIDNFKKLFDDNELANDLRNYIINVSQNSNNILQFRYSLDKRKKSLVINLPKKRKLKFMDLFITHMMNELKLKSVKVTVDGTLVISNLAEVENLSYLDENYHHNKLIVRCTISPKILKAILTKASFDTIDLTNAKFSTEMRVDMNNRLIKNKDCNIIANPETLEVIR